MTTRITADDFAKLAAPFAAKDHEFNRGFIYIEETAICSRIEEVDFSWEWKTTSVTRESDVAIVVGELTIKGVTRYGTGQQVVQRDKEGRESVGEASKGATTDALKRAARLFGIGRYLLQCPANVKGEGPELNRWLASLNGKNAVTTPQPPMPAAPVESSKPQPPAWWPVLSEYKPFMEPSDFNAMRDVLSEGVKKGTLNISSDAEARTHIERTHDLFIDTDAMRAAAKEAS